MILKRTALMLLILFKIVSGIFFSLKMSVYLST